MVKVKILYFFLSVVILLSCSERDVKDCSMEVFCLNETTDFNKSISCNDIKEMYIYSNCNEKQCDTVLVEDEDFEFVKKVLTTSSVVETPSNEEVRVYMTINNTSYYITDKDLVLDEFGRHLNISDKDVYKLKSIIGYYNTLDLEILEENALIKKYGVPKDYIERKLPVKDFAEPKKIYSRIVIYIK